MYTEKILNLLEISGRFKNFLKKILWENSVNFWGFKNSLRENKKYAGKHGYIIV